MAVPIVNTQDHRGWVLGLVLAVNGAGLASAPPNPPSCAEPLLLDYTTVASQSTDPRLFTQGFEIDPDGDWWLSGGGYGQSRLQRYASRPLLSLATERALSDTLFAEGISLRAGELWLLTWQSQRVLVFDLAKTTLLREHAYRGEGWGLAHDAEQDRFIMSNGSNTLSFRSARDFSLLGQLPVRQGTQPLRQLNELEYIKGELWANVWRSEHIVRIDLGSGCVTGLLDLSELWPRRKRPRRADVLNGIAHDRNTGLLWVTGKRWGRAFGLQLGPGPTMLE